MTSPRVTAVLEALSGPEPRHYLDVAALVPMHPNSSGRLLKILHAARSVYVAAWDTHDAGRHTPRYLAGNLPDVPKPAAKSRTERAQEAWRKLKADPVLLERRNEARRLPAPEPLIRPIVALNWRPPK